MHVNRTPLTSRTPLASATASTRPVSPLQRLADASPHVTRLLAVRQLAANTGVMQLERTVTNSQRTNMQDSLVRMYGGDRARWQIDQESGSTFDDNNNRGTTGHHNVRVTDADTGTVYLVDFHQNGAYYTRSHEA